MDFRASADMFIGLVYLTVISFAIVVSYLFNRSLPLLMSRAIVYGL